MLTLQVSLSLFLPAMNAEITHPQNAAPSVRSPDVWASCRSILTGAHGRAAPARHAYTVLHQPHVASHV